MQLTKEQTLLMIVRNNSIQARKEKHIFTTKTKCLCLSCLTPIFLSFKEYAHVAIFCDHCFQKFLHKPTLIQYQYIRVQKERQMALLEKKTKKLEDIQIA